VNTDFPTALQQVDLIGFAVGHLNDGTGGFDYGVDNWQLFVPEPGDAATLAMALLAVAFFSRRRIGQLLDRRRPLLMPAGDRSSARVTWTAFLRLSTLHACRSCSERAGEERVRVSATTRLPMALCTVTALPALSAGAIDEPHLFASSCDACRLTHGAAEGQLTAVQGSWLGYAYNNALTNMDVQSFLKCPANGCQKSACQASCTSQHGSGGSENG
jgi:hypothetical protein